MALRVCRCGCSRFSVAHSMAALLPSARFASKIERRGTELHHGAPGCSGAFHIERRQALAEPAEGEKRLGDRSGPFTDRSDLVVLCLLAPDLFESGARV